MPELNPLNQIKLVVEAKNKTFLTKGFSSPVTRKE
jgi:hypothetical protein